MIEEGWFSGDDVYEPTDPDDPALFIWQTHYRPEIEAYDLLREVFRDRVQFPFGAYIPELGFELAEHPFTPRHATAKLNDEVRLPYFAAEVARRTSSIVIVPSLAHGEIMR
ncbi:hypothetical protein [Aestuariivita boseongensis]|uniref:hypothetical protein n=1 Tax=Aestuariivita boseongensis TaxID=1470562 RepID=UPI00067FCE92|nr:hypothetical protein [Aestuariivita boseongensis]